jgi:hypothetical protein
VVFIIVIALLIKSLGFCGHVHLVLRHLILQFILNVHVLPSGAVLLLGVHDHDLGRLDVAMPLVELVHLSLVFIILLLDEGGRLLNRGKGGLLIKRIGVVIGLRWRVLVILAVIHRKLVVLLLLHGLHVGQLLLFDIAHHFGVVVFHRIS